MMAVSPNGRYLACFGENGVLIVLGLNLEDVVLRVQTAESEVPLSRIAWMEDVSVVARTAYESALPAGRGV